MKKLPFKRLLSYCKLDFLSGSYDKTSNYIVSSRSGETTELERLLGHIHQVTMTCRYNKYGVARDHLLKFKNEKSGRELTMVIAMTPNTWGPQTPLKAQGNGSIMLMDQVPFIAVYNRVSLEFFFYRDYAQGEVNRLLYIDDPYARFKSGNSQVLDEMEELRKSSTPYPGYI